MLTRWRRRARRGAGRTRPDIEWYDFGVDEAHQHPTLVLDILAQDVDGATVRGVFRPEEVDRALARLSDHRAHETPVVFGTVLGRPLMQSGMSRDRTEHLDDAERHRPVYLELFGIDPHERLADVFAVLSGGMEFCAPLEDGRPYNPGQIRIMEPGGGGLPAHAGNEFLVSNREGSASHLWETTDALDHLSYFVMMQPPDEGGELSVYDKLWDEPTGDGGGYGTVPLTHEADDFDEIERIVVAPDPGDLIVFRGGRRWHRVEKVFGSKARITYGGFAAPSREHDALNCWA